MEDLLVSTGLTRLQAQAYLYLLGNGPTYPSQLTAHLNITRTNAYKVLESLEKSGLVSREEKNKKIIFAAEDPAALASLVAEQRNSIIALEQNVNRAMQQLCKSFARSHSGPKVRTGAGRETILKEYRRQAERKLPIFFVRSRADIPFMGFEAMDSVRKAQGRLVPARFGLTQDVPEAPADPAVDKRTGLIRTWIDERDYTAPVEWSVSGDNLTIQVFEGDGRTVTIQDELVAESFKQLWQLLDRKIRGAEDYKEFPKRAKRAV